MNNEKIFKICEICNKNFKTKQNYYYHKKLCDLNYKLEQLKIKNYNYECDIEELKGIIEEKDEEIKRIIERKNNEINILSLRLEEKEKMIDILSNNKQNISQQPIIMYQDEIYNKPKKENYVNGWNIKKTRENMYKNFDKKPLLNLKDDIYFDYKKINNYFEDEMLKSLLKYIFNTIKNYCIENRIIFFDIINTKDKTFEINNKTFNILSNIEIIFIYFISKCRNLYSKNSYTTDYLDICKGMIINFCKLGENKLRKHKKGVEFENIFIDIFYNEVN